MSTIFRPMLAATVRKLEDLEFPLMGMPKYDGIRCIVQRSNVLSRTLKPIPNDYIRDKLQELGCVNATTLWDGEIIIPGRPFNEVASAVMSKDGFSDFIYVVFDRVDKMDIPYSQRYKSLQSVEEPSFRSFFGIAHVTAAPMQILHDFDELASYEEKVLSQGYEGIILRSPTSVYKFGRSTMREQGLMKYKRTEDAEGIVVGKEQLMHNDNSPTINNFGHTERTSHQDSLSESGMLGSLLVRAINGAYAGQTFKVSCSPLTLKEKIKYWHENLPSELVTFTYAKYRTGVNSPLEPRLKSFKLDV